MLTYATNGFDFQDQFRELTLVAKQCPDFPSVLAPRLMLSRLPPPERAFVHA